MPKFNVQAANQMAHQSLIAFFSTANVVIVYRLVLFFTEIRCICLIFYYCS